MQNLTFVIGATATGKTYFIDTHYIDKPELFTPVLLMDSCNV